MSETPLEWDELKPEQLDGLNKQDLLETIRHYAVLYRQARTGNIDANDSRLEHIWERAGEIADEKGYCDVFETFMDELGTGFTREVEYCVTVEETIRYDIHVTASRNAETSELNELIAMEEFSCHTELDRSWEITNVELP